MDRGTLVETIWINIPKGSRELLEKVLGVVVNFYFRLDRRCLLFDLPFEARHQ